MRAALFFRSADRGKDSIISVGPKNGGKWFHMMYFTLKIVDVKNYWYSMTFFGIINSLFYQDKRTSFAGIGSDGTLCLLPPSFQHMRWGRACVEVGVRIKPKSPK